MAVKPTNPADYREVTYTAARWVLLQRLRGKAVSIMETFEASHLHSVVHGSLARGDVKDGSDIDVFIPEVQNSFQIEAALLKARLPTIRRYVVQATPANAMKAHIEVDEETTVSFSLMTMRRVEREFYGFGGEATLSQLNAGVRAPGIDKRLMLIEPTKEGHVEGSVIGREEAAAKLLRISAETVLNRVHTLIKRDTVGRTGVFVKKELAQDETFELALKKLAVANPAVRRRLR